MKNWVSISGSALECNGRRRSVFAIRIVDRNNLPLYLGVDLVRTDSH